MLELSSRARPLVVALALGASMFVSVATSRSFPTLGESRHDTRFSVELASSGDSVEIPFTLVVDSDLSGLAPDIDVALSVLVDASIWDDEQGVIGIDISSDATSIAARIDLEGAPDFSSGVWRSDGEYAFLSANDQNPASLDEGHTLSGVLVLTREDDESASIDGAVSVAFDFSASAVLFYVGGEEELPEGVDALESTLSFGELPENVRELPVNE